MKKIIIITFLLIAVQINAQNVIEWDGKYQIQLSDFKSKATQIGNVSSNSIQTVSGLNFSIQMSNVEFMFTKNFNSKVSSTFKRESASIIATDTLTAERMMKFAQYEFDLSELYAQNLEKTYTLTKALFQILVFSNRFMMLSKKNM